MSKNTNDLKTLVSRGVSDRRVYAWFAKKELWQQLNELAATLSKEGRDVSPAQVAAVLLERALASVKI